MVGHLVCVQAGRDTDELLKAVRPVYTMAAGGLGCMPKWHVFCTMHVLDTCYRRQGLTVAVMADDSDGTDGACTASLKCM